MHWFVYTGTKKIKPDGWLAYCWNYEGELDQNNKCCGFGTAKLSEYQFYEGTFWNDKFEGIGNLNEFRINRAGEFKNGKPFGKITRESSGHLENEVSDEHSLYSLKDVTNTPAEVFYKGRTPIKANAHNWRDFTNFSLNRKRYWMND